MALLSLDLSETRADLEARKRVLGLANSPNLLNGTTGGWSGFAAAKMSRTTTDWNATSRTADQNLMVDLRRLRNRARQQAINSPIAAKYLRILRTQVVGEHGIQLDFKVQKLRKSGEGLLDDAINQKLSDAWEAWTRLGVCTVDGKRSLRDVCMLAMDAMGRDGDMIVRRRYQPKTARNPFGFALQMIDADQLDDTFNTFGVTNGVQVRMGVESNSDGLALAYHLFPSNPYEIGYDPKNRVRVPAEEIYHLFEPRFVSQSRGYPMLAPAMYDMQQLDGYFSAELAAARAGAKMVGAVQSGPDQQYTAGETVTATGATAVTVGDATVMNLPPGTTYNNLTPEHPSTAFNPFVERAMRLIASGGNVPYHELGNDYASVNFSSGRLSVNEARDFYREMQSFLIERLVRPIFEDWLRAAILNGALDLSLADIARYTSSQSVEYVPRAWHGIQPLEEAKTAILEITNGLNTKQNIAHSKGQNWYRTLQQLKVEADAEEKLGLELGTDITGKSTVEQDDETPPPAPPGGTGPAKK